MGEYADSEIRFFNNAHDAEIKYSEMLKRIHRHVWQSEKDGEFHIRDMKTSHISNCIKMLCKRVNENELGGYFETPYLAFIGLFQQELKKRKESNDGTN